MTNHQRIPITSLNRPRDNFPRNKDRFQLTCKSMNHQCSTGLHLHSTNFDRTVLRWFSIPSSTLQMTDSSINKPSFIWYLWFILWAQSFPAVFLFWIDWNYHIGAWLSLSCMFSLRISSVFRIVRLSWRHWPKNWRNCIKQWKGQG